MLREEGGIGGAPGGVGTGSGSGGIGPVEVGRTGEDLVRSTFDIGPKEEFRVNGRTRIADGLNRALREISEVKNTARLSLTRQIRDYIDYAQKKDLTFYLWVRGPGPGRTNFSGPLQAAVEKGLINVQYIP